jgi:cytochrome c peroxidase
MHDRSATTLADVIDLYNRGEVVQRPSLSPEIKPLGLEPAEKDDLIAFLRTLTSRDEGAQVPSPHVEDIPREINEPPRRRARVCRARCCCRSMRLMLTVE